MLYIVSGIVADRVASLTVIGSSLWWCRNWTFHLLSSCKVTVPTLEIHGLPGMC